MKSLFWIIKQVKELSLYLLLIIIYFFFINLEAKKEKFIEINKDVNKKNKLSNQGESNSRISIPVIPYNIDN